MLGPWRRRVRNPSIPFTITLILLIVGLFGAFFGPSIVERGLAGYRETRRLREREFVESPETWIRPWLVNKIDVMLSADQPHEWRPVDFRYGPCDRENVSQLPSDKLREAISRACGDLHATQMKYAEFCAVTDRCSLPNEARVGLLEIEKRLDLAFEGVLFDGPVTYEQSAD
ncbi:MAG: hypothetical protein HY682_06230 [Chloroflexi bacterium]|nr:hypothetical protein [Chloroflexota bacterium]